MARANGHKRLSRKARHLISRLRRTKHASVQDVTVHELKHEINRSWWSKAKPMGRVPQTAPGGYRPPTRKAGRLLTQLRRAKVWRVQQRLVKEIEHEIEHGRRVIERARVRAAATRSRVRNRVKRTKRGARKFRRAVSRGQERVILRAERKAAEREKNGPGRARKLGKSVRERTAGRLRARRKVPVPALSRSAPVLSRAPRASRTPRPLRPGRARAIPRPRVRTRS